jgi:hypothetical protein
LEAALKELSLAGIRDVTQSFGSKHLQLRWQVNGSGMRLYSMAGTPSDVRAAANVRSDIRKILREDGMLLPAERRTPAPRPPDRITILERRIVDLEQRLGAMEQISKRPCPWCGRDWACGETMCPQPGEGRRP